MGVTSLALNISVKLEFRAPETGALVRRGGVADAWAMGALGVAMLALALGAPGGMGVRIIEVALSVAMVASGVLLARAVVTFGRTGKPIGLLPGELALAAAMLYLGTAAPTFHLPKASYGVAVAQFLCVLVGLFLGAAALVVDGASQGVRPRGKRSPAAMVRYGVTLIVGTILLAIGLGQLPNKMLMPPKWSWISFLGITIPGMLLLVAREGVKQQLERSGGQGALSRALRVLATDALLVLGLSIMLFGSFANLNLGMNGYQTGFKGNSAGLLLWAVAALALLLGRGWYKLVVAETGAPLGRRVMSKLLYVVGVVAFIYGERSVLSGKAPMVALGGAAPVVSLILLGALLVLVAGQVAARRVATEDAVEGALAAPLASPVRALA